MHKFLVTIICSMLLSGCTYSTYYMTSGLEGAGYNNILNLSEINISVKPYNSVYLNTKNTDLIVPIVKDENEASKSLSEEPLGKGPFVIHFSYIKKEAASLILNFENVALYLDGDEIPLSRLEILPGSPGPFSKGFKIEKNQDIDSPGDFAVSEWQTFQLYFDIPKLSPLKEFSMVPPAITLNNKELHLGLWKFKAKKQGHAK